MSALPLQYRLREILLSSSFVHVDWREKEREREREGGEKEDADCEKRIRGGKERVVIPIDLRRSTHRCLSFDSYAIHFC